MDEYHSKKLVLRWFHGVGDIHSSVQAGFGSDGAKYPERTEFLVSTLQGDAFTAIMYAQRARGDLSFKEICHRLESRYEGEFSTPAAAWMKLNQAFQQRNESLSQWSDRLNRIGDSIFRLDVCGKKLHRNKTGIQVLLLRLGIGRRA